jgi:O-antigen/teichoic acid export membrane protein
VTISIPLLSRIVRGLAGGSRRGTRYAWGFADQALSSATSFGLTLLAGRALGADGLGIVALGFSAYFLILNLQRSFVMTPLVSMTAALAVAGRREATSSGLVMVLLWGVGSALIFVATALAAGGPVGEGLLLFAPWLLPTLLHEYWRAILFRDERPRAATLNDGVWLGVLAATAPFALASGSDWAVVGSWGAGAVAGASCGLVQVRLRPDRLRRGLAWWRSRALGFGRWLALQNVIHYGAGYAVILLLIQLLGTAPVGGLRAAMTLFVPFSLIGPAIFLPGLPAMARALAHSAARARRLAWTLSLAAAAFALVYMLAMLAVGETLLGTLFGSEFREYAGLVWALGVGQIGAAPVLGFTLLLKAQLRGSVLVVGTTLSLMTTLVLVPLLAWQYDLIDRAAWGYAAGSFVGTFVAGYFAMGRRRTPIPATEAVSSAGDPDARGSVTTLARRNDA